MKVKLLAHTPEPEKLIAAAAKNCYSSSNIDNVLEGLTEEKTENFVNMLSEIGHESAYRACFLHLRHRGRFALAAGADHPSPHGILFGAEPALCTREGL